MYWCIDIDTCVYIYIYIYMYVMCICTYIYIYIYIYTRTYIHIPRTCRAEVHSSIRAQSDTCLSIMFTRTRPLKLNIMLESNPVQSRIDSPINPTEKTKGVPRKGAWTSVNIRAWACKELRVTRDQPNCYLRPAFVGTPLVPSKIWPRATLRGGWVTRRSCSLTLTRVWNRVWNGVWSRVRPFSLLILSLLTLLDSNFPGNPRWAWEFHPFKLRLWSSQTLWNPQC